MRIRLFLLRRMVGYCCLCSIAACTTQAPVVEQPAVLAVPHSSKADVRLKIGADGWMLAANCFGCHGPQGRSRAPGIPSLAGLSETYFGNVMRAYQYGGRYGSVMGRIALAYDDAEILRMARYFRVQEPDSPQQTVDWSRVLIGRRLHRQYCRDCHGDPDSQPDPDAVSLNGQWTDYLRWTLQDYLVGINQTKAGMAEALAGLVRQHGEQGVEDLIQYYASGRP